jgi:UDP-N-acetylglucosamine/UDP-N-acetylgalactosamine diphosphorylase
VGEIAWFEEISVDLRPKAYDKVVQLVNKGVVASNPLSLDVGEEVNVSRISGEGVVLYPGCRLYGARTVVSAGCKLGAEGPVTVDDCWLGPEVELKGGSFKQSVFLEKASMGPGAQVREGCLLEEQANGAHTVGLKQTILLSFVTLGSLINFCDCLMAGGTSRKDHSEVGSSYIHFNYTPDGGKATASLFGDVPRGVMLAQPPIFLGGQGGAVGPIRVAYGTVVAAGSILRRDVLDENKLVVTAAPRGLKRDRRPGTFPDLARVVRNNVIYLANLAAMEAWYAVVREPFFARQDMGSLVYEGALATLTVAKEERTFRLRSVADRVPVSTLPGREFSERVDEVCSLFAGVADTDGAGPFLARFDPSQASSSRPYVEAIGQLPADSRAQGVAWLQGIVDAYREKVQKLVPSIDIVGKGR